MLDDKNKPGSGNGQNPQEEKTMQHNDWKVYRRNQRMRRIAQEQAQEQDTPDLYASRLKSDDAIEAEIEAMAAEERRVIDRSNEEIVQVFANTVVSDASRHYTAISPARRAA